MLPTQYPQHSGCSINENTLLFHNPLFANHTYMLPLPQSLPQMFRQQCMPLSKKAITVGTLGQSFPPAANIFIDLGAHNL